MYIDAKENFNQIANIYDSKRRVFIPCFDDFYQMAVEQITFSKDEEIKVLDLGAGTGLLSAIVRSVFPRAKITLMDFAEDMLEKARERFLSDNNISFVVGDYFRDLLPKENHIVMSALSIHHLPDKNKQVLYQKAYDALLDGGKFINADLVLGKTEETEAHCYSMWVAKMHELGIAEEDFLAWKERLKEDRYADLDTQLAWLREAGFSEVDCFYRYYNFAVFSGKK